LKPDKLRWQEKEMSDCFAKKLIAADTHFLSLYYQRNKILNAQVISPMNDAHTIVDRPGPNVIKLLTSVI
jgi:hypothetical protein